MPVRNLRAGLENAQQGAWKSWQPLGLLGQELNNKTIGIVGLGEIGQALARKLRFGWNMNILYCGRNKKEQAEAQLQAKRESFEELLMKSDFVSVHCPLTPATKNLFNETAFNKMRPGSIFINTARGEIHDEQALLQAIESGHLFAAGLDVTNPEPMAPNAKLLACSNVFVTPHIGSATFEARAAMSVLAAQNILAGLAQRPLPAWVNPSRDFFKSQSKN